MCGIFGFAGDSHDKGVLRSIAEGAGRRGMDGYGIGWLDETDKLHACRSREPLRRSLQVLDELDAARVALGHARLATVGGSEDLRNFHPFLAGQSTLLVHNGNLYNFRELKAAYGIDTQSDCDSEVMAHLVARQQGSAGERLLHALSLCDAPAFAVGVIVGRQIAITRRRLPLFFRFGGGRFYFSSFKFRVHDEDAVELPEDCVFEVYRVGSAQHSQLTYQMRRPVTTATPEKSAPTQSVWQRLQPRKGQ